MREQGDLPGIIPTPGWGYEWGNGPVSDGVLFELPYRLYLHSGDKTPLVRSLPYFRRYLQYIATRQDADGFVSFGLDDWANPREDGEVTAAFINGVLLSEFCRIAALAAELAQEDDAAELHRQENAWRQKNLPTGRIVQFKAYVNPELFLLDVPDGSNWDFCIPEYAYVPLFFSNVTTLTEIEAASAKEAALKTLQILSDPNISVAYFAGHGTEAIDYNGTSRGSVIQVSADYAFSSWMPWLEDELQDYDFSSKELVIFCGCETASGDSGMTLPEFVVSKGARVAIGFSDLISDRDADLFSEWFFLQLQLGRSIEEAVYETTHITLEGYNGLQLYNCIRIYGDADYVLHPQS